VWRLEKLQHQPTPMVTESGYSWFKRIILLPFLSTFIDDKDVNKIDELITPEELSGFLNLALVGLKQLVKDGDFTNVEDARVVQRLFDDIHKTVSEFVSKKCVRIPSSVEYCEDVYKAYCQYCKSNGITALENNTFGVYLHEMGIEKIRPMVGGIRKYAYKGIKLKQG